MPETRDDMPTVGQRVTLVHEADRFPHALVPAGATGTVNHVDAGMIGVRLDEHVEGLEEWENDLMFYAEQECAEGESLARAFWARVEETAPAPAP